MGPSRVLGLLLIALGAALLVAMTTGIGGEIVVLMLGGGFLIAYVATRSYGLLIPGAILTGLGTGIVVTSQGGPDEAVVLGLGAGFLAIAVVDVVVDGARGGWWWPLIPGGVLTTVGASTLVGAQHIGRYVVPAVLIVIGVALLLRGRPKRREAERLDPQPRPEASEPSDDPAEATRA